MFGSLIRMFALVCVLILEGHAQVCEYTRVASVGGSGSCYNTGYGPNGPNPGNEIGCWTGFSCKDPLQPSCGQVGRDVYMRVWWYCPSGNSVFGTTSTDAYQ